MAITISIGVGLKQVNNAKSSIKDENFLLQTNIIVDDVLTLLEKMPEMELLQKDESGDALEIFLSQSEFIPFEASGIQVGISIKSARSKVSINHLLSLQASGTAEEPLALQTFKSFLAQYNVGSSYFDMLLDSVSEHNITYNALSDIIDAKPDIYRDNITSIQHLEEINNYYRDSNYDNALASIDFEDLFYFGDQNTSNYCIDNNHMSPWTRHMLQEMSVQEAEDYYPESNAIIILGFNICKDAKNKKFLEVELEIIQDEKTANIRFEYNIKQTKGYNFSYEI